MSKEEIIVRIFASLCEYNKMKEYPTIIDKLWEEAKEMAEEIYLSN